MATSSSLLLYDNSTDANFRAWGSGIKTALAAVGLTQTSDTGQIDWTTVTRPTISNSSKGYEIWRFSDTLQATVPVFIKLEYGSTNGTTAPDLWITVGYATDGAGSITGTQIFPRRQFILSNPANQGASTFTCIFSGSTNRIQAALWINSLSSITSLFSVERSKDNTGADTADGVMVGVAKSARCSWQVVPFTGGVPSDESKFPAILTNNSTYSFGTTVGMSVVTPIAGTPQNPGLGLVVYKNADFVRDSTPTVSVYGSNHTYWCLSNVLLGSAIIGIDAVSSTTGAMAIRYE